jgi:hypothetical protein
MMIKPLSATMTELAVQSVKRNLKDKKSEILRYFNIKANEEFKERNEELKKAAIFYKRSEIQILNDKLKNINFLVVDNTNTQELNQYLANLETAAFAVAGQKFDLGDLDQCNEIFQKLMADDVIEYSRSPITRLEYNRFEYRLFSDIITEHQFATLIYRSLVKKICEEEDAA